MKAKRFIFLILALAQYIPMQAQYDGLIVKMDYFDPDAPKYHRHVEMSYDIFKDCYWLTVSTTKTTLSEGSTKVVDDVAKTRHYHWSKTTTDTIVSLTKADFNKLAGDCYQAASILISEKVRPSSYGIIDGANPTINLSITNGPMTMEFLFKCPICPQDNCYEEQFRDVLARILSQGGLDSEKMLGTCGKNDANDSFLEH